MNLYPKNRISVKEVKKLIIIFYMVGVIGFLIPQTTNLFKTITPLALILSTYLLAVYHKSYSTKSVVIFLLILLLGFFIEVVGVNTSLIFGSYHYGKSLGFKLFETPLLIGINWLFLTYTSISLSEKLKIKGGFALFSAPLLMLLFDIVLELVAPKMDMWYWQDSTVPLKNYIAWYIIGVAFVAITKVSKINTDNPIASFLFICQFIFFIFLTLFL